MVPHLTYSYSAASTGPRHYAVALLLTAVATVLAWITRAHASCYVLALIMSALYGGRVAGFVTLASSLVCFTVLIALAPTYGLTTGEIPRLVVFAIVCVIVNDLITSKRKAQSALREQTQPPPAQTQDVSEQALRDAIDSFPCMVVVSDPEGGLQYANRQLLQFVGKRASDLIDGGCTRLLHADDASRVIAERRRSLETGVALTTTYRLRRHDGEYRWIETRMQPLRDMQGHIVRWYGVHMDVHESMTTAHTLRDTQAQLSRASQIATVAELSASIAHEVNQPLAAMVTNGHACLNWLRAKEPNLERASAAAERIVRDGTTAAEVIRRIRALFRQAQPVIGPFHINATIGEVLGLMHRELRRNQIAVELDLDASLPVLNADRLQIRQTLFNLVDNAIDALAQVAVHRRRLVIRSARDPGGELLIEIRDHGPGLDDANQIFQPFFTTKQDGMGMGLAICRSIVEAHGGHLWASNHDGSGATLHIRLPFAAVQGDTTTAPAGTVPPRQLHGHSR
jgi:PAS domain S-box-containing protein